MSTTLARSDTAHWRDVSRSARFFVVDAIAALPLVVFLLHIRLWTFITAISIMIFFLILEKFQFTVIVFFRWLKNFLGGPIKTAYPWWRQ